MPFYTHVHLSYSARRTQWHLTLEVDFRRNLIRVQYVYCIVQSKQNITCHTRVYICSSPEKKCNLTRVYMWAGHSNIFHRGHQATAIYSLIASLAVFSLQLQQVATCFIHKSQINDSTHTAKGRDKSVLYTRARGLQIYTHAAHRRVEALLMMKGKSSAVALERERPTRF